MLNEQLSKEVLFLLFDLRGDTFFWRLKKCPPETQ